jgi:uncharacterized membrane protein
MGRHAAPHPVVPALAGPARVTAEHVAAPADAVYAAIADLDNLPRFAPQMTAVRSAEGDRVEVDARYEGREQHRGGVVPSR